MSVHSHQGRLSPRGKDSVERLVRVVRDVIDRLENLGALVALDVGDGEPILVTAGFADLARTREVGPGDIYQIGSQSKALVAAALVRMAGRGLLALDDPIGRHVDLPLDPRITVRHLITNTSGMGEYTSGLFAAGLDLTVRFAPRDLIALALPQGQLFTPGERFDYSNTGWVVAALVIEAVTGQAFADAMAEWVVEPLGLRHMRFGGTLPPGEPMRCYVTATDGATPRETTRELSWGFGAGDGVASAPDVMAFFRSLMRANSPLGVSLATMTAETAKPSNRPRFPMSFGTEYGMGLERRAWAGSEVWGHPGSTMACRTSTWIDPARQVTVATAVTTNLVVDVGHEDIRYPRAQLFSMALNTAYALADDR